jgi:hypothetical protein
MSEKKIQTQRGYQRDLEKMIYWKWSTVTMCH